MGDNGCECSAKTAIERVCASLGVWSFLFFFLLFDISIILELWIKKPDIDTDTGLYRLLLATGDWRFGPCGTCNGGCVCLYINNRTTNEEKKAGAGEITSKMVACYVHYSWYYSSK